MVKSGKLNVIDGGKKRDLVTCRVIIPTSVPPFIIEGQCDLDLFSNALEALQEQTYLDLVDSGGRTFRVYQCDGMIVMHMGTVSQSLKLILPK
jgi:hypothetical protein